MHIESSRVVLDRLHVRRYKVDPQVSQEAAHFGNAGNGGGENKFSKQDVEVALKAWQAARPSENVLTSFI